MNEFELIPGEISKNDNTMKVEMTNDEIWFLKYFLQKYNPKKIVEIGISAGGNTVNLLKWKDKNAQLFSIDIATNWYRDNAKLSGFMAEELDEKEGWKIYRGYDYLEVCEEIGNDIDFIIIDTVHAMPGEFLTFLAALPKLKDGCLVVLHDIHLNMKYSNDNNFNEYAVAAYCTGLLFGGVSSNMKWTLKSDIISNIGAFVVDQSTRENIKDIFHILCAQWYNFPSELNLTNYSNYIRENYDSECYDLFITCLKLQSKFFNYPHKHVAELARVDIINKKNYNSIEILDISESVDVNFPNWFKTVEGRGAVLQTKEKSFDLKLKCVNDGLLKISLRGPDIRDDFGNMLRYYVNFSSFYVNNKNIIDTVNVWHDEPYVFEKNVIDGEILDLHFEWEPYNMSNE